MISFANLKKEIASIAKELASLETPKFRGQKEEFPYWISTVEQVFTRYNLEECEKFKVVIGKLRGYALEWWEKYKNRRKKRGKSKIRTWDKLRGKLMDAFTPTSYLHKHPFLPSRGNDVDSSSKDIPFNKGSPMSSCIPSSTSFLCLPKPSPKKDENIIGEEAPMSACIPSFTSFLCLEKPTSNKDEKILKEEVSSLVDLPPIFDDYGGEELIDFEGYELEEGPCYENNDVNFDLPPRFDEHEEDNGSYGAFIISDNPQKFELKQEEIIQGFEQCVNRGGCPYSQQELRTILFQQGEYDVYLLGDYTQPFSSNPFELASFQIQARQDLFSSPWFEFKGKRHFMEFYLNFKMPTLKRSSKNGEQAFQRGCTHGEPSHDTF